ncbi:hypothetical protein [Hugenholtzia roseola]|uniref:hypothetical protein n=1 Tax=Hugenholtzia roseola TaxID=1002 RepID=UPI0004284A99|nr:hypothetical protein [Hugenholtzia roseola]
MDKKEGTTAANSKERYFSKVVAGQKMGNQEKVGKAGLESSPKAQRQPLFCIFYFAQKERQS